MLDIVSIEDGKDLGVADSAVLKAANVVSTQIGSLEYAPNFGSDLKYFLENPIEFQNESFKAYLTERLTYHQVSVSGVAEIIEMLNSRLTFYVGDGQQNTSGGFIR